MVLELHPRPRFNEAENGLEMTDIVRCALPFDPLSQPLNSLIVEKKIKEIFAYRERKLAELFNNIFLVKEPH